mmetsp:Transcript_26037/g.56818  ORF Transcript_26037/g.56818 Transcript_26037/m.56818 type:complete len:247 (+) Transcript_26037:1296-2036(+)
MRQEADVSRHGLHICVGCSCDYAATWRYLCNCLLLLSLEDREGEGTWASCSGSCRNACRWRSPCALHRTDAGNLCRVHPDRRHVVSGHVRRAGRHGGKYISHREARACAAAGIVLPCFCWNRGLTDHGGSCACPWQCTRGWRWRQPQLWPWRRQALGCSESLLVNGRNHPLDSHHLGTCDMGCITHHQAGFHQSVDHLHNLGGTLADVCTLVVEQWNNTGQPLLDLTRVGRGPSWTTIPQVSSSKL